MLKLLSRNLFKISYVLLPRSKPIATQNISKSNLQYVLQHLSGAPKDRRTISEANASSSTAPPNQQIRQQIIEIYSILSNERRLSLQRSMSNNDPNTQFERDIELQSTIQDLSKCISRHHKTLSLKSVKHCLVILKKVHERGLEDSTINSTLALLEQQFCFLHENPFIFKKRFQESITILNSFTALNYRLSNKEYLSKWYKYSIENLKNFSSKEICKILYVSVFQMPENKEIYNTVKLQLFRPSPYYLQEVLKTRLYVNPKDYKKVTELLKVTFNRIFLSSYERKGLYWEKDFEFTLSDIVTVLQSYSIRGEKNESYLSLLIQILKQTLQESIKTEADAIKNRKQFLKLLPVIANLSESEAKYREQDYNHIVEVLVSVVINTIPSADVKQLSVISKNFNALWDKAQEKQGLKVCMTQLLEALTDNLESMNTDDVLIRYSGEYNEILTNLAPAFMEDLKDDQVKVLSEKFRALTLSYLEKIVKVIQGSIFYDWNNLYRTNQLIQKLEESREVSENVINKLRKSISDINFKGKETTESLAWNYLICFSLQTPADGQISKTAQDNADYFTNYLIENLEIKSLNEQVLIKFFEIYANLFQSRLLPQIHIAAQQNLDKIRRSFMRYIADHHQGLSIKGLEEIIEQCMRADLLESDFDDGSGLYSQNLLQEMNNHITKHLKEFSSGFQEKIKPYLEKYAEETAFETLTQTIKNISI